MPKEISSADNQVGLKVDEALDIGDLPLKGKIYSPVCTLVQPSLIVVTYKETTPV